MSRYKNTCNSALALVSNRDEGRVLEPSEEALLREHLAGCPLCRLEQQALERARLTSDDQGPAQPLDELRTRRLVDAVLAKTKEAPTSPRETRATQDWLVRGALAVAAMAAIGIGGWWLSRVPEQASVKVVATVANPTAPLAPKGLPPGRVLLASAGNRSVPTGPLLAGQRLETDGGRLALSLPTGIRLLLEPHSQLTLTRVDQGGVETQLEAGQLLAEVDPNRRGPLFTVATDHGRIVVKGTAFAVNASAEQVNVLVLRGRVAIDEDGQAERFVEVGQATTLGAPEVRAAKEAEMALAADALQTLALLGDEQGGTIEVRTLPAGALVRVDGARLGETPLSASLAAGEHRLVLEADGYAPIHELLKLEAGDRTSRLFDLSADASVADTEGATAPALTRHTQPQPPRAEKAQTQQASPAPTADALLAQAQAARRARAWTDAAAAYAALIARYPTSELAQTALVSLGQLELKHLGHPSVARADFDKYLARTPNGPLAEEAAYGRIEAFEAEGRTADAKLACVSFVSTYPSSMRAAHCR